MYRICPKCKYERQASDDPNLNVCPVCGLLFSKWMKHQFSSSVINNVVQDQSEFNTALFGRIISSLFFVKNKINPFIFYGRIAVFIGITVWGWYFINMNFVNDPNEIINSFMHRINLVFHEAGHLFFMPFGWFMTKLGGTLGQLLIPVVVILTFLIKEQDNFGASVGLWWLGQSFMDCAPYIDDGYSQQLVLLGGVTGADSPGTHDWNSMLIDLGKLESHREIANIFNTIGITLILIALFWGGSLLYKQFKRLDSI